MSFNIISAAVQLLNIFLWIGIIYFIYRLIVKLPKQIKELEDRLDRMENLLEEINKKLD